MGQTVNSQVILLDYGLPQMPESSLEDVVPIHMKDWFEEVMDVKFQSDYVFSHLWLQKVLLSVFCFLMIPWQKHSTCLPPPQLVFPPGRVYPR